jgi:hypothetical protein
MSVVAIIYCQRAALSKLLLAPLVLNGCSCVTDNTTSPSTYLLQCKFASIDIVQFVKGNVFWLAVSYLMPVPQATGNYTLNLVGEEPDYTVDFAVDVVYMYGSA